MRGSSFDDICTWFRERQELFLDGELSGSENFRFQQHLKECDDCAQYWADDESLSELLMLEVAAPIGDPTRVPGDQDYQPRIPRIGEERRISHHSTTFVLDSRRGLIIPTLAAAAASILVFSTTFLNTDSPAPRRPLPIVTELATADASTARIYPQGRVEVRRAGGAWRALESAADIEAQVEIRTGADSRILVDLGDHDHFVLNENTMGRLGSARAELRLELLSGSFSCDFAHRDFRMLATGLEVVGRDSAFDLRTGSENLKTDYESRIAVTRGDLQARSDVGASRKLASGDVFAVRDGRLVAFDRVEPDIDDAMLAKKVHGDLGFGVAHLPTDISSVSGAGHALPIGSVASKIEEWLQSVVASGGLNLVDPDAESRLMLERVAAWGPSVLPEIRDLFEQTEDARARRALLGLASAIAGDESRDFLIAAAGDASLSVRKASLLCLSRRTETVPAAHFLRLLRDETDRDLSLSAAFLAASLGEVEGLRKMRAIHREAASSDPNASYWRQTVLVLAARLDADLSGREDFLLSALESWVPTQGTENIETILSALGRPEDLPRFRRALSVLSERPELEARQRRLIRASLEALDS